MADLRISELVPLGGASLSGNDLFAVVDASASETKKITVVDAIGYGVTLIADATIPGAKVVFNSGSIPGSALVAGAVGTAQLADRAVTAAKLADESTVDLVTALPAAGAFIGQLALDTGDFKVYCWDGVAWQGVAAPGSINAVNGDSAGLVNINVVTAGDAVTVSASLDDTSAASQFLAGPTAGAGPVSYRGIVGDDLPPATTSSRGAVLVNGEGLRLDGAQVEINNDVTPSPTDFHVVNYDSKGLVTAGRVITSADIPAATAATKGAVLPGLGLAVDGIGTLNHTNVVAAGSYAKVTVDAQGHVSAGGPLASTDVPQHSADLLTSGTLSSSLYGDRSITQLALADYAVSYIQEAEPPVTATAAHIGMLWFQESTGALRMWNGNSWFPVGFGRLAQDNLRWGGLFDASTGLVTGVTNPGVQAGLAVGGLILPATDQLGGLYLVCEVGGSNVIETPGLIYDPGDWLLCVNQTNGWKRIDTLSGGGNGGAAYLDDLLDVTLSSPQTGQVLTFNSGTGRWNNQPLPPSGVSSVYGRTGAVVAVEGDYSLGLLGDVSLNSPATGNLLQFDGSVWVNVPSTSVGGVTSVYGRSGAVVAVEGDYNLDLLGDVTLTTPTTGNLLQFNGTQWVNVPSTSVGGVLSVTAGTGLLDTGTATVPDLSVDRTTVDSWYAPASHVGVGGAAHADVLPGGLSGFMSGADKSKLDGATAAAVADTLVARDASGNTAVNMMTAAIFDLDALPALP